MNQTKRISTLLIAILVLLLALTLAACNDGGNTNPNVDSSVDNTQDENNNTDTDDGNNDDGQQKDDDDSPSSDIELSESMKLLIKQSKADIDAMFNYFLTLSESAIADDTVNNDVGMILSYCNGAINTDFVGGYVYFGVDSAYGDVFVYVLENESSANWLFAESGSEDITIIGNKVIQNNALYQQVLNSTRPAPITKFTEDQIEFVESKLHRGIDNNEAYSWAEFDFNCETNKGTVGWDNTMIKGNCATMEGIGTLDDLYEFDEKFMSFNYTDDSYVKYDEATGLVSLKLIDKPGWHIEEIKTSYFNEQTQRMELIPTGKYIATYFYKDLPASVTVPAKLGDYDIEEANINLETDETLDTVVIENDNVQLHGPIKQITISVRDVAIDIDLSMNTALKNIIYSGTTQKWEELYGTIATNWTHVYDHYDEDKCENVYVDITFTVVCTDGRITYPKAVA